MTNEEFEQSGLPAKDYWHEIKTEEETLAQIPWYWVPYCIVILGISLLFSRFTKRG